MSNPEQLALERGICAEVGPYSISHFVPPRNYSRSVGNAEVMICIALGFEYAVIQTDANKGSSMSADFGPD